jgi:pimeloyl-ACP methyl ester carboxylesterase
MKAQNGGQQDLLPNGELVDYQPQWFKQALAIKSEDKYADFQDARLHFRSWAGPSPDAPNVVMVHGGGAHARWYDFIAPLVAPQYNVISVDLPGMGDSGWLQKYDRDIMADGVMAMVRAAGFTAKPAIIAHSMGGMVSLLCAHNYHQELAALMICDYYVRPPYAHEEWYMEKDENGVLSPRPTRDTRVYEDFDTALARFRLQPEQPCANQFIVDYIGGHSLREVEGGWTWKFDPHMYRNFPIGDDWAEIYANVPLPLSAMFGELAREHDDISREELVGYMQGLRPQSPHFDLLAARHHVLLDQPLAFASSVMMQMQSWQTQGAFDK